MNVQNFLGKILFSVAQKCSSSPEYAAAVLFFIFAVFALLCFAFLQLGRLLGKNEAQKKTDELLRAGRTDAVKRSRAVLSGQMAEQIAPFLKDFPCNPADVRFVGKPLDFIGFPGAADGGSIQEILFIEEKTGSSSLSKREKEIKTAVENGRVRYVEYYF